VDAGPKPRLATTTALTRSGAIEFRSGNEMRRHDAMTPFRRETASATARARARYAFFVR
jgi:hypothetical protein